MRPGAGGRANSGPVLNYTTPAQWIKLRSEANRANPKLHN